MGGYRIYAAPPTSEAQLSLINRFADLREAEVLAFTSEVGFGSRHRSIIGFTLEASSAAS